MLASEPEGNDRARRGRDRDGGQQGMVKRRAKRIERHTHRTTNECWSKGGAQKTQTDTQSDKRTTVKSSRHGTTKQPCKWTNNNVSRDGGKENPTTKLQSQVESVTPHSHQTQARAWWANRSNVEAMRSLGRTDKANIITATTSEGGASEGPEAGKRKACASNTATAPININS